MAIMFPPELDEEEVRSRAERVLFKIFQKELNNEYTIIHSANWNLSAEDAIDIGVKGNGEADFVVIHPDKGIIVIEAKSKLTYLPESGRWRSGSRRNKNPLKQPENNRYALERALERAFRKKVDITFGFALALPEFKYESEEAVGLPRSLILDCDDVSDISRWFENVFQHIAGENLKGPGDNLNKIVDLLLSSGKFSDSLIAQLELVDKTIQLLTKEQFKTIDFLRSRNRVAIKGCAGSGKTLVAVEKAIRLDRAGLKTLLLCHNPYLAESLKLLSKGTDVTIIDFCSWINQLIGNISIGNKGWTHYDEPDARSIDDAFDKLVDVPFEKYDAIIVDEGQDFREEWWIIVETALKNSEYGILYIFYDDNQCLLPYRGKYPFEEAPYLLSKNCRNAGEIFELIRRFDPGNPEISVHLKERGIVKFFTDDNDNSLDDAIRDACYSIDEYNDSPLYRIRMKRIGYPQPVPPLSLKKNIVVLTNEPDPIFQSKIYRKKIRLFPIEDWQNIVCSRLDSIRDRSNKSIPPFPIDSLSKSDIPEWKDIDIVAQYASKIINPRIKDVSRLAEFIHWQRTFDKSLILNDEKAIDKSLAFFISGRWAQTLPFEEVQLVSAEEYNDAYQVPLYTISSFKGLEANSVVLFLSPHVRGELYSSLYVGISRAVFLLHIVGTESTIEVFRPFSCGLRQSPG